MNAELWNAVSGEIRPLQKLKAMEGGISLRIRFEPYQSFFIVFDKPGNPQAGPKDRDNIQHREKAADFPAPETIMTVEGPWTVEFDPAWVLLFSMIIGAVPQFKSPIVPKEAISQVRL